MWQTDIEPVHNFESAARVMGVNRARDLWAWYDVQWKRKLQEADAIEQALAKKRQNKKYIVNEELGGAPAWTMARASYVDIFRASVHEKGCRGGELLDDDHYMKWLLKRNPALRISAGSGKIMSGWTPARERSGFDRLKQAHDQGVYERQIAADQRGGVQIAA